MVAADTRQAVFAEVEFISEADGGAFAFFVEVALELGHEGAALVVGSLFFEAWGLAEFYVLAFIENVPFELADAHRRYDSELFGRGFAVG